MRGINNNYVITLWPTFMNIQIKNYGELEIMDTEIAIFHKTQIPHLNHVSTMRCKFLNPMDLMVLSAFMPPIFGSIIATKELVELFLILEKIVKEAILSCSPTILGKKITHH